MIPKTSVSLLNAIATSHDNVRWIDFYDRYQPILYAYLQHRFPSLDSDDIIQESMLAFMGQLPTYKYDPTLKGSFHNYLLGIAKFKSLEALRRRVREGENREKYEREMEAQPDSCEMEAEATEADIRRSIAELAIRRFLDDNSVSLQSREVFRRTALAHERPETVAEAYGITRNHVDQIKARAIKRIREITVEMKAESGL